MGRYLDIARQVVTWQPEETGPVVPSRAISLRRQAQEASTWDALYTILDEAQTAYDAGEVTCEEVESLTGYAADKSCEIPEHSSDSHLSELLARQPVVRVRSRLLGEVVVWVADGVVNMPEGTDEVVYRETELRRMEGLSPTEVRTIHKVKRALDGELM